MRIDIPSMRSRFLSVQSGKASNHSAVNRARPSIFQYDYLALNTLSRGVRELIGATSPVPVGARALDIGCDASPYRGFLEARGYQVATLDLNLDRGADFAGTVENTGLQDHSFDLVICTQVLEHCSQPWDGMSEISRILKPAAFALISVPHVWFYHPHPHDHWRFTQEGVVRLCEGAGLKPVSLIAQGGTILTLAQIVNFVVYGVAGRWAAPVYAGVSLVGRAVDRALPNDLFCHNFACLARKC